MHPIPEGTQSTWGEKAPPINGFTAGFRKKKRKRKTHISAGSNYQLDFELIGKLGVCLVVCLVVWLFAWLFVWLVAWLFVFGCLFLGCLFLVVRFFFPPVVWFDRAWQGWVGPEELRLDLSRAGLPHLHGGGPGAEAPGGQGGRGDQPGALRLHGRSHRHRHRQGTSVQDLAPAICLFSAMVVPFSKESGRNIRKTNFGRPKKESRSRGPFAGGSAEGLLIWGASWYVMFHWWQCAFSCLSAHVEGTTGWPSTCCCCFTQPICVESGLATLLRHFLVSKELEEAR